MKEVNTEKRFGCEDEGFTLLELLIVLLITAIVSLVLGTVIASSFQIIRTGETRAQLQGNARVALDFMASDLSTMTGIPSMVDRDYNGVQDDQPTAVGGFGSQAYYLVGQEVNNVITVPTNIFLSEAFSDHIMTEHAYDMPLSSSGKIADLGAVESTPVFFQGQRVAQLRSLFRLAVPADQLHPYYLAGDNSSRMVNNNAIPWYPSTVQVGGRSETGVLMDERFYKFRGYSDQATVQNPGVPESGAVPSATDYQNEGARFQLFPDYPVASNVTRIKFEYFHKAPVYQLDNNGAVLYVDTNADGHADSPVVAYWKLVPVDVVDNSQIKIDYRDQYNRSLLDLPGGGTIPVGNVSAYNTWNMDAWYTANDPPGRPKEPKDFNAWTTDGKFQAVYYDTKDILGVSNDDPGGDGTPDGNADGIPDGDGIPDDPLPAFWIPYVKAIRITVVATPASVIQERMNKSGKPAKNGYILYYNLDSPVPYADQSRTLPLVNMRDAYIGEGRDVIMSKMIYPKLMYATDPIVDPRDSRLTSGSGYMRRADVNYYRGFFASTIDQVSPDRRGVPVDIPSKYLERNQ
jgi:prepilin-type N-terminal cleavage/methylation domain-containing protein